MIDFSLSQDEELLQRTARDFAERRLRPNHRKHEHDGVPEALISEVRELGLTAVDVPSDVGGAGLGPFAQALVLEELGAADVAATLALDTVGPARYPVMRLGSPDDKRAILDARRAALIVDDSHALQIEGDRVSGTIPWSLVGDPSVVVVVSPAGAMVLDGAESHARPVRSLGLGAAGASELRFDRARVRARCVGDPSLALAEIRVYASSLLVGLMRSAYEYVARYAQERITFGRPLAHHQAVAFMIVEMAMAASAARLATWRAAHAIANNSRDANWASAAALAESSESALLVTNRAVQLLGGHGYLKDHPVEKWMREARTLTLAWGGPEALADAIGESVVPPGA
jgi:alkylation response protein AidB-like acyl-CoA dehydrogenase